MQSRVALWKYCDSTSGSWACARTTDGRPGIAVLPFCDLSGDPEQAYFADGVTEDLMAVLSRSPDLLVISRNSSTRPRT